MPDWNPVHHHPASTLLHPYWKLPAKRKKFFFERGPFTDLEIILIDIPGRIEYEHEYERVVNPLFVFVFGLPDKQKK
jgi:hypothetical protein